MPRPCNHPTGEPQPANCRVCWLYVHHPEYRDLYDRPAASSADTCGHAAVPYQWSAAIAGTDERLVATFVEGVADGCKWQSGALAIVVSPGEGVRATTNDGGVYRSPRFNPLGENVLLLDPLRSTGRGAPRPGAITIVPV